LVQEYEIELFKLDNATYRVLKHVNRKSFIDKIANDPKRNHERKLMFSQLNRLGSNGIDWALRADILKRIKDNGGALPLYELRCLPGLGRIMVYLHNGSNHRTPVLLFEFTAHKASKSVGGMREETLLKGQQLAAKAKALMESAA